MTEKCFKLKDAYIRVIGAVRNLQGLIDQGAIPEARRLEKEITEQVGIIEEENPLYEKLSINQKYEEQVKALRELGLLQTHHLGHEGILTVDGRFSRLSSLKEIKKRIWEQRDKIRSKVEEGFTELALVPFGVELQELLNAAKNWITGQCFLEPKSSGAIYFPKEFSENHGGKTKKQILAENKSGWMLVLTSVMPNVRPQIIQNQTLEEYLKIIQTNSLYEHEKGMIPEVVWSQYIYDMKYRSPEVRRFFLEHYKNDRFDLLGIYHAGTKTIGSMRYLGGEPRSLSFNTYKDEVPHHNYQIQTMVVI